MKANKIDPELERKIDLYINGQLDTEQIDDLWVELIQDEKTLDYIKTVATLKMIVDEQEKAEKATIYRLNRNNWVMAAVAAIVLIVGAFGLLQLQFGSETQSVTPISSIELDYYRSADGSVDGSSEESVIRQAIVLANQGDYQLAVEILETELNHIRDANSRALLYINAGSIFYNTSIYEEAALRFEEVVDINESDRLVRERAYWYLGNTYFQLNKIEEARTAFQKAYELDGAYSRVAQSYLRALASN